MAYRLNEFINEKKAQSESQAQLQVQASQEQRGRQAAHQRTRNGVRENFSYCLLLGLQEIAQLKNSKDMPYADDVKLTFEELLERLNQRLKVDKVEGVSQPL